MVEGGGQFEECVEGDGGFVEYKQQIKKRNDKYEKSIYKYQAWTATTTAGSVSRSG